MTRTWRLALTVFTTLTLAATMTAQGPATDRLMRKKLEVSQQILEAVVTSHWSDLEMRSRDLEELTNDPAWMVLTAPEYATTATTSERKCARCMRPPPNGIWMRRPRRTSRSP